VDVTDATVVIDASTVIRATVGGSAAARDALVRGGTLLAPDLIYAECVSALVLYCRAGQLSPDQAEAVLSVILDLPLDVETSPAVVGAALTIALERGISAYDACYVALAEAADAPLVTADRRLAAGCERAELIA
jgi:predicted nucleic acid-binding protein